MVGENLILLQYLLPVDAEEHGYVGMEPVVGEYLILLQYLLQVLLHVLHYLDGHLPPI